MRKRIISLFLTLSLVLVLSPGITIAVSDEAFVFTDTNLVYLQQSTIDIRSGLTSIFAHSWAITGGLEAGIIDQQIYGDNMYGIWSAGKYMNSFVISLTDGSVSRIETGSLPTGLSMDRGSIYAALGGAQFEPGILRMPHSGRTPSSTRIYQGIVYDAPIVHGGKLYFISFTDSPEGRLFRMGKDGSGLEAVLPHSVYTYNISSNTLYYSPRVTIKIIFDGNEVDATVGVNLFKMDLATGETSRIAEGHISQIYVLGDRVYYIEEDYSRPREGELYSFNYSEVMKTVDELPGTDR